MPTPSFQKVLCCLDRTETDLNIIRFTKLLSEKGLIKHVKFLHVIDNDLEEKARLYADHESWLEYKNEIRKSIKEDLDKYFESSEGTEVIVRGGSALEVINTKSKSEAVDLVIVGNKIKKEGSGIAAHHIARSSLCDVVFISDMEFSNPESVLFAYDFSEHSEETIELGYQVSQKIGVKYSKVLNVLASPKGFFKSGRLHKDFVDSEKQRIQKMWKKELESHPDYNDFHFEILENEKSNIAHYIEHTAAGMEKPIVFLGSKGKTASSAFLLGSVTEKIILGNMGAPIWIHKMRGENFDLFDAIFKGD